MTKTTYGTKFEQELHDTIDNESLRQQIREIVSTDSYERIYANMIYNAHAHRRVINMLQARILN